MTARPSSAPRVSETVSEKSKANHKPTISEAVSEKPTAKRGRPRLLSDVEDAIVRGVAPNVTTPRGRHNVARRQRAVCLLKDDPRFAWLCDPVRMEKGDDRHAWRPGLLTELGRIDDVDDLRSVALRLCELRPRTIREGIAIVRQYRLGAKPADADSFARAILRAVDDFLLAHPGTPLDTLRAALWHVLEEVEQQGAARPRVQFLNNSGSTSQLAVSADRTVS